MAFLHSLYIDFWALSIPIVSTDGINKITIIDQLVLDLSKIPRIFLKKQIAEQNMKWKQLDQLESKV